MSPVEIRKHLRTAPFQPICVHLSDGPSYRVPHPDFIYVTQTLVVIGLEPVVDDVPARSVFCDPLHITRIEPLSDGRKRKPRTRRRKP